MGLDRIVLEGINYLLCFFYCLLNRNCLELGESGVRMGKVWVGLGFFSLFFTRFIFFNFVLFYCGVVFSLLFYVGGGGRGVFVFYLILEILVFILCFGFLI